MYKNDDNVSDGEEFVLRSKTRQYSYEEERWLCDRLLAGDTPDMIGESGVLMDRSLASIKAKAEKLAANGYKTKKRKFSISNLIKSK